MFGKTYTLYIMPTSTKIFLKYLQLYFGKLTGWQCWVIFWVEQKWHHPNLKPIQNATSKSITCTSLSISFIVLERIFLHIATFLTY